MTDFTKIDYLKEGNTRQKIAYNILMDSNIMSILARFNPILVGTFPINIDVEGSDLDIICYCDDKEEFMQTIEKHFEKYREFKIREVEINDEITVIANLFIEEFEIEIFGQNIPSIQQAGYLHMLIENKLLTERGEDFRLAIIDLKKQGMKTEPAFAKLLGLSGNPYQALLNYIF